MYRKLNITFKFSHQTSETSTWFLWVIVQTIDFAVFRMNETEREREGKKMTKVFEFEIISREV